jgi:DNA-binding transcriptional ArsR family regulator
MPQIESPPPDAATSADLAEIQVLTVLEALSDPVRLEIVRQLAACPETDGLTCGQIELPVAKSTASHHLKTLSRAGIIAEREEGTCKHVWLRRAELDKRFPGLIESVLRAVG